MPKFHIEKLTNYDIDSDKINLFSYDNYVTVYDDFTKIDIQNNYESISKISLKDGSINKLWLGIESEGTPNDENFFPFKNATLNYDAQSIRIKDFDGIKICTKLDEHTMLPDFVLDSDGEFLIMDDFNSCKVEQEYITFSMKDSGNKILNDAGNEISFRHALDLYKDDEKVSTYQGKTLKNQDNDEFYLAYQAPMGFNKKESIRIIDPNYPNFAKGIISGEDFHLSDLELRLSLDENHNPKLNFYYENQIIDTFSATKRGGELQVVDILTPVINDIEDFIYLL
jgi:hypothetical protein